MEMQIVETVLALVLVYLVMALLVSHLQELLSGWGGGRGRTLAKMVDQVFNGDRQLARAFFAYPPIDALSRGSAKPSSIPPDLFAQAWLAVLNGGVPPRTGKPPAVAPFATPADFVAKVAAGPAAAAVLRHLAADAGTDWDAFEANVARWIADVGDRATGWFKRWKALWLLALAAALAFLADADTFYMARVFMSDEQTRVAFANLGELVNAQHQGAKADDPNAPKLAPARSSTDRARQAGEQFVSAASEIGFALKDPKVLVFGSNRDDVRRQCGGDLAATGGGRVFASNSDAWVALMPVIMQRLGEARLGVAFKAAGGASASRAAAEHAPETREPRPASERSGKRSADKDKDKEAAASAAKAEQAGKQKPPASAAATAQATASGASIGSTFAIAVALVDAKASASASVPASEAASSAAPKSARPGAAPAVSVSLDAGARAERLGDVLACANVVHSWVASAQHHADDDAANIHLANAEKALQAGIDLVNDERIASAGHALLPLLLLADPDRFQLCASQAGADRGAFDQCLAAGSANRVPIGWQNRFSQLCSPDFAPDAASAPAGFCPRFGSPELDIAPIATAVSGWSIASVAGGLLFTALMVSLGAPFWWGVLGKVADLRLAGRVRGLDDKGNAPPPSTTATRDAPPPPPAPAPAADAGSGVQGAANAFERGLQPQDVTRVQKALGIDANGRLDEPTRNAIEAALKAQGQPAERELSAVNYPLITGRQAAVAATPATTSGEWRRGQTVPLAARTALVNALNTLFPQPAWLPLGTQTSLFDDALRARVVQYRVLDDPAAALVPPQFQDAAAVALALQPDSPLCRLDDTLRQAILASKRPPFARLGAYWLEVALGELGITEDGSPAQSNSRVIEYLNQIAVAPIRNDETPWCGAFVGWTMDKAGLLVVPPGLAGKADLLRAVNWQGYGVAVAAGSEQAGDVCVVQTAPGQHHVGFWIAGDATRFWLLGGNQGKTGQGGVTLVAWRRTSYTIVVRRPAAPVAPPPAA